MMKLIQFSDYKSMPWKNNQGTTFEIAISDSSNPFLWRLSAAKISGPNSFSEFAGYDRLLTIWTGQGLQLNQFELLPNQIFQFKGEDPIHCQLLDDDVVDIGFIYNREQITAKMECQTFIENQKIYFDSDLTFLFCAHGEFQISGLNVKAGDTVKIENSITAEIQLFADVLKLIRIDLKHIFRP